MEVRLWHEFARYVSLIAAKTTEGRSLFAPAFLCDHSRNEAGVRLAIVRFSSPIQRGAKRRDSPDRQVGMRFSSANSDGFAV